MRHKNPITCTRVFLFNLALISLFAFFNMARIRAQEPASLGFSVPTTPILPDTEIHPSLYFHKEKIHELKDRRNVTAYSAFWADIAQRANSYKLTDPAFQDESARPRMAKTLAFWWIIEDDTVTRDKAIDALIHAYDGVPQTGEKPYDEIYRATWLQNYCAAYDWVFDQLNAEEDSTIRGKITEETQFLRDNLTEGIRMAPRPHNHRSKPAWAICTAALTLSDHPNASDWLEYGLTQANTVTEYQFTKDGIYREGGHYWVYSAVNFIPFLWHYYNVSDVDLFPYFEPAFTWTVAIRTGQGWIPNFEDANVKPAPTHMVAAAYKNTPTSYHSNASLANILQWNYWSANVFTPAYTGATNDATWEIDNFILYDASIESVEPDCHPTLKLDGGQVIFRNRWEGGEGHRYLALHAPSPGDNHNHPDQLSFVVEADQGFVMPDAGYGPDGFSDDRRNTWYTTAKAHNIITANFYAPMYIPADVTPPTPYFITSDFFSFTEKQMAFSVFPGLTQSRGIAFIGGDYWVVTDLLREGSSSVLYRSYLHGRGTYTREANVVCWTSPSNKYGMPVRMDAFLFPSDMDISEDTGYISLFWDEGAYTYVAMDQQAVDAVFMNLLIPSAPSSEMSDVTDLSGADFQAATVMRGDTTDIIIVQTALQELTADGVTMDGSFGWARRAGNTFLHAAFRETRIFSLDTFLNMVSDVPLTAAVNFLKPEILAFYPGSSDISATIEFSWLQGLSPVTRVTVNDVDVPFSRSSDRTKITFTVAPSKSVFINPSVQPDQYLQVVNYPNPFNGQTNIHLQSSQAGKFLFTLYNVQGQRIWEQRLMLQPGQDKTIVWDGRNIKDVLQSSGVYFGHFRNLNTKEIITIKLVMIR